MMVKVTVPDRADPKYQVLVCNPPLANVPVISIDDEESKVQVVTHPRIAGAAFEGEKEKPIDVELLADVDV